MVTRLCMYLSLTHEKCEVDLAAKRVAVWACVWGRFIRHANADADSKERERESCSIVRKTLYLRRREPHVGLPETGEGLRRRESPWELFARRASSPGRCSRPFMREGGPQAHARCCWLSGFWFHLLVANRRCSVGRHC